MGWCGSVIINGNSLTHQRCGRFCKTEQTSEPGIHKNNQTDDEVKVGFMNFPLQRCKTYWYSLTHEKSTCGHMTAGLRGPNWLKGGLWLEGEADTELSTCWAHPQQRHKDKALRQTAVS